MHSVESENKLIRFCLNKKRTNMIFKMAEGFWHVESPADRPGFSRVWLKADLVTSRIIPPLLLDYASARALPRATSWIRPYFEKSGKINTYDASNMLL